jgi:N-acyl-D-aspartate/D-glutamate deacylase
MLDTAITGGLVVDGTGAPARRVDIGIKDGRTVVVGKIEEPAARTIDVDGLVVSPGFVDLHTHYDPHVMWDSGVTPSSLHGVTTIIGGNCGFTIAPITEAAAEYLVPMLARVEGMPLGSLEACLDLGWDSFGSWLDRLEGRLAVNAGFLVGHSAIRRIVMGDAAVGQSATDNETERMVDLLHQSLDQGALGLSSSYGNAHNDHNGDPVPSRWATLEEFVALASAVEPHAGTTLEFIPYTTREFSELDMQTMVAMSVAANRPLNWNLLTVAPGDLERQGDDPRLEFSDRAAQAGATVQALALPIVLRLRLSFLSGFIYDAIPGWSDTIFRLPPGERIRALREPEVRRRLREGVSQYRNPTIVDWDESTIADVASPKLAHLTGKRVGEIAADRAMDPFDVLLDVVAEDDLLTGIQPRIQDNDDLWRERLRVWRDRRTILGGSDAGAHLDMLTTYSMHTQFLAEAVRQRQLLPIEEAIWYLTDLPARFYGLRHRGRIAEGWHADIVVFDPATIGPGTIDFRADLPAGGRRLYSEPEGVAYTITGGVLTSDSGTLTGATPGTVLRSGTHTETMRAH